MEHSWVWIYFWLRRKPPKLWASVNWWGSPWGPNVGNSWPKILHANSKLQKIPRPAATFVFLLERPSLNSKRFSKPKDLSCWKELRASAWSMGPPTLYPPVHQHGNRTSPFLKGDTSSKWLFSIHVRFRNVFTVSFFRGWKPFSSFYDNTRLTLRILGTS